MPKDELIAALEKATGGSHALDAEVGKAMGWERRIHAGWYPPDVMEKARKAKQAPYRFGTAGRLPAFTASIDASLTLVDTCGGWFEFSQSLNGGSARITFGTGHTVFGEGKTPALAICITALRANQGSLQHPRHHDTPVTCPSPVSLATSRSRVPGRASEHQPHHHSNAAVRSGRPCGA